MEIEKPRKYLDGGSTGFRLRFDGGKTYQLKCVNEGAIFMGNWDEARWKRGDRSQIWEVGHGDRRETIRLDSPLALQLASLVREFRERATKKDDIWYADWIIKKMSRVTFDEASQVGWGHSFE